MTFPDVFDSNMGPDNYPTAQRNHPSRNRFAAWVTKRPRNKIITGVVSGTLGLCILCACIGSLAQNATASKHDTNTGASLSSPSTKISSPTATLIESTLTTKPNTSVPTPNEPTATPQRIVSLPSTSQPIPPTHPAIPPTPKPKPTAPPARLFITFTCADATDYSYGEVCVHTQPGAALTITVTYCSGRQATSLSLQGTSYADGSGNHRWSWEPETKCQGSATAYVSASWHEQDVSNSKQFTVN